MCSSSIQWGTQLRQRWMPSLLLLTGVCSGRNCSSWAAPWSLLLDCCPGGCYPPKTTTKVDEIRHCMSPTDLNRFVLTNFLSIFALMSLARVKKACTGKQEIFTSATKREQLCSCCSALAAHINITNREMILQSCFQLKAQQTLGRGPLVGKLNVVIKPVITFGCAKNNTHSLPPHWCLPLHSSP